jgi:hypothetical protein
VPVAVRLATVGFVLLQSVWGFDAVGAGGAEAAALIVYIVGVDTHPDAFFTVTLYVFAVNPVKTPLVFE